VRVALITACTSLDSFYSNFSKLTGVSVQVPPVHRGILVKIKKTGVDNLQRVKLITIMLLYCSCQSFVLHTHMQLSTMIKYIGEMGMGLTSKVRLT